MIYLDHAAATPLDPAVLKKMLPYFSRNFANPSSVHGPGQAALKAVDDARYAIAEILGAKGPEIIFCSGATEANNLALRGLAEASGPLRQLHIISTPIEHASILEPLAHLKSRGVVVTYLRVDSRGVVSPADVIAAIRPETALITIALANSETGVIQPLKAIGRLLRKYNEKARAEWLKASPRKRGSEPRRVLLHTDATQAPHFLDCRPAQYQADLMSLSGHKLYGPKGIGLLYIRSGLKLSPLALGGHQERNFRSGTVNVPGVIGLSAALTAAAAGRGKNSRKIGRLRDSLLSQIKRFYPEAISNSDPAHALPSHLNISFPGYDGDALLSALDSFGIAVSTGSACASGDITVSPVLRAMGRDELTARGALRFSLGKRTTPADIRLTVAALKKALSAR